MNNTVNKRAFLDVPREGQSYRPREERIRDYAEVELPPDPEKLRVQAERCMNCGIPFCHGSGCPLENVIPEFNAAVANGRMEEAWALLASKSNFPEFTSRVCPALCEAACTCGYNLEAVAIRSIERRIVDYAFEHGLATVRKTAPRTGRRAAVVGAGPAGLAAADELNRMGHSVTVFERDRFPGGLLRYGIPDFKLSKEIVARRISLLEREGVRFECGVDAGKDISCAYLRRTFDAVVLACGTRQARDLGIPGRELEGIAPAVAFLSMQERLNSGEMTGENPLSAKGRKVLVIGGGDTGSDCVGTAIRQGAESVMQVEIMPEPPEKRSPSTPWPMWPYLLRTSSSHKEGCERRWNVASKEFLGRNGRVSGVRCVRAEWTFENGRPVKFAEKGEPFEIEADLILLAMGFTGIPAGEKFPEQLGLSLERNLVKAGADGVIPGADGVFAAGDVKNGPSLVVRAIASGRKTAESVDAWLRGRSIPSR